MSEVFDIAASHPFIRRYLNYVENTETPRIHHLWAALSGVSACMGRRCWYPENTGQHVWANMFIVLVGPPAVRKSTALKLMEKLLRETTTIRFAPNDTGGQRQGIIAAMNDCEIDGQAEKIAAALSADDTLAGLAGMGSKLEALANIEIDLRDPRTLYICESELKAFLGENNTQMTTFMQKMYDGDSYEYRLKTSASTLKDALLGMLGATTPSEISLALPAQSIGGGFTSRIIFVYADRVYKKIARHSVDFDEGKEIAGIFSTVFEKFQGPFTESEKAGTALDNIYYRGVIIKDPRFVNYVDRRHTHLKKVAMALAASRKSQCIEYDDVYAADQLLLLTEENMADALGEYGMSPLSAAKQKMLEYIRHSLAPIPVLALWGVMSKDMKFVDFQNVISELHNTGKIKQITIVEGGLGKCVVATSDTGVRDAKAEIGTLKSLLAGSARQATG